VTARVSLLREMVETLRPSPLSAEEALPPLMVLLTIVTGLVDAVAYLRLGHVFVANMTGNVVFLGFAAGGARGFSVTGSLLAVACFLPGGAAARRLVARAPGDRALQLRTAASIQAVLFAAALLLAGLAGSEPGASSRYGLIVLLALAMGVQNATARHLAVRDMTTTVLTQTLTGLAAESRLGGGSGGGNGRRLLTVAAMALGALLGALLLRELAPVAPLGLAEGLLLVVCVGAQRASVSRRRAAAAGAARARGGAG